MGRQKRKHRPPLTVTELQERASRRASVNHTTYKRLYEEVQSMIRARAAAGPATAMLWTVPVFVPERPLFPRPHAARYVRDKLRKGGFVAMMPTQAKDSLLISWDASLVGQAPRKRHKRKKPRDSARGDSDDGGPHSGGPSLRVPDDAIRSLERLRARLNL